MWSEDVWGFLERVEEDSGNFADPIPPPESEESVTFLRGIGAKHRLYKPSAFDGIFGLDFPIPASGVPGIPGSYERIEFYRQAYSQRMG